MCEAEGRPVAERRVASEEMTDSLMAHGGCTFRIKILEHIYIYPFNFTYGNMYYFIRISFPDMTVKHKFCIKQLIRLVVVDRSIPSCMMGY